MRRYFKPLAVGVSLIGALFLTVTRYGEGGGLGLTTHNASRAARDRGGILRDPAALNVFKRVLLRVTDSYVEPARIRPSQMLVSALHGVERNVPEVLVQESSDKSKVTVRVQDSERTFDLNYVKSPWTLSPVLQDVLRFIEPHLDPSTKKRDVEYAAINGMLSTLDPHSVLLRPDIYAEMKLSTRGEFGGLGIVISMIQGVLTVMNPMKGTPAAGAGIKSCDQILKIGKESTVNMTLTQAVQRLRGAPGSPVTITIARGSWKKRVRKQLKRAIIKVDSVTSRMLSKKIGYIRLRSFQGNSHDDLRQHLKKLKRKGMRGLVLDLRSNPGGLLDQAIKISDVFVDSGTIVTTVSHAGRKREEKRATRDDTEERYPLVALVNSGSASASEIVAGALKQLDRGVLIGRRTFGKGSVQVLYDNDDGSALKLTIAQYLTPGDVSIQSVGITPDIATAPVLVRRDHVRLRRRDDAPREMDLDKHLTHRNARREKPSLTVRHLAELPDIEEEEPAPSNLCLYRDRRCKPTNEDRFVEDFQIRLARDLLARAKGWRRSQVLASINGFFDQVQTGEERRIAKVMEKFSVDWSERPSSSAALAANKAAVVPAIPRAGVAPKLVVAVSTDPTGAKVDACKPMELKVTVRNAGSTPVWRLAGVTESTNAIFADRELVFGHLAPGQSRSWTIPIKLRDVPTRVDEVKIKLEDGDKNVYPPHRFQLSVRGVERPVFAYGYQLIDDVEGNSDGRAQRGEVVRLFVRVRNTGSGAAFRTVTTLKNLAGVGIFIRKGRFVLGRLAPGESKTASFSFEVEPGYDKKDFKVELAVYDDGLQEAVSDKLRFDVAPSASAMEPRRGRVRVAVNRALFRSWPHNGAPVVGEADNGAAFRLLGQLGDWYRVAVGGEQSAFVAAREVVKGGAGRAASKFRARYQVTPPKIALRVPSYSTDKAKMRISGTAKDEHQVVDLYVYVRNPEAKISGRKVYYRSNRKSKTPSRLDFAADVPLWKGTNYVSVFARENNDVQGNKMVVIFRSGNGPKSKR